MRKNLKKMDKLFVNNYNPKGRKISNQKKKEIEEKKEKRTLIAKINSIMKKAYKNLKRQKRQISNKIWTKFNDKVKNSGSKKIRKDHWDLRKKISKNSKDRIDLKKALEKYLKLVVHYSRLLQRGKKLSTADLRKLSKRSILIKLNGI